jgi:hypothetical protein
MMGHTNNQFTLSLPFISEVHFNIIFQSTIITSSSDLFVKVFDQHVAGYFLFSSCTLQILPVSLPASNIKKILSKSFICNFILKSYK